MFLAGVAGGPRVAQDRNLEVQSGHLGYGVGDDVVVYHRDDRYVQADHGPQLRTEMAGGVDHVLGDDASLLGDGLPAPVRELVHVDHPVAPYDLRTQLARSRRHGVGCRRRVGPAVAGSVEAQHHPVGVHQGVQAADLVGTHQMGLHAHQFQHPVDVFEPVGLVGVGG